MQAAVKIHQNLGAQRSLGVHWCTFVLTDALDEPPRQLVAERSAAELAEEEFFVLAIGATRRIFVRPAHQRR